MQQSRPYEVAKAIKAHGLKGAFKIQFTQGIDPQESSLFRHKTLYVGSSDQGPFLEWSLEDFSYGPPAFAKVKEVNSLEEIESHLPFSLYLRREHFQNLSEGELYLVDLLHLPVYALKENGKKEEVAFVQGFYHNGVQDILVLSNGLELPFIKDFFLEVVLEGPSPHLLLRSPEFI